MSTEADLAENVQQAAPFFSVSSMPKSVHYYVDGLGFEMTKQWVVDGELRWCWVQLGDSALMLQEFPTEGTTRGGPAEKWARESLSVLSATTPCPFIST